jgi:hypothetical protein
MICYASRTGTRRTLDALRAAGWRLILSPAGRLNTHGFQYALDNGAWSSYQQGVAFDVDAYTLALEKYGGGADWVVAPDIVAGGFRSLDLSVAWLPRLSSLRLVLIAVQDGVNPRDVAPIVSPGRIGIFLGGSTDWKLATMQRWGDWANSLGVYFHVGRVNTSRRIRMAIRAGADSIDGTSVSRFSVNLPKLDAASRARALFAANGSPTKSTPV